MRSVTGWVWLLPAMASLLGCNSILGFDADYKTSTAATGGNTASSGSQSGGGGTSNGGTGGGGTSNGGTGGGGTSNGGTSNGGTSNGGTGGSMSCTAAEDCPAPPNSCSQRSCDAMVCGTLPTPKDTTADQQTPGDCGRVVCDGTGSISLVADDSDPPPAMDECHMGSCEGGPPHQVAAAAGTACSVGGKYCDGAGVCVECLKGGDCASGVCAGGACASASCGDGAKNGGETDVDCGGPCGASCVVGQKCGAASDCVTGNCASGTCAKVPVGGVCKGDAACASGFCVGGICCSSPCVGACNTCGSGTCTPVAAGTDPGGTCAPSVCNGGGSCGVCQPGTNIGKCCMTCAKSPDPKKTLESAIPAEPSQLPPCCYNLFCGPDGEPERCL